MTIHRSAKMRAEVTRILAIATVSASQNVGDVDQRKEQKTEPGANKNTDCDDSEDSTLTTMGVKEH